MSVQDQDFEVVLRTTLSAWAEEAPEPEVRSTPSLVAARPSRRRILVTRLAPIAVAAAVIAIAVVVQRDGGQTDISAAGRELVTARIHVGDLLGVRVPAAGPDALFVASENDRRLYRVDMASNSVTASIELAVPDSVSVGDDGAVYAFVTNPARLARLDPTTLTIEEAVDVPGLTGLEFSFNIGVIDGRLWVVREDTLLRFDPVSLAPIDSVPFDHGPGFLAHGPAGLWRTQLGTNQVLQLDPETGAVLNTVTIDGEARAIAVDEGAVWVSDIETGRILRIDAVTGTVVATVPAGAFPTAIAIGDGRLWVSDGEGGTVSVVDTRSNTLITTVPVGTVPGGVVSADGSLWVSLHQEASVVRLDPNALEPAR